MENKVLTLAIACFSIAALLGMMLLGYVLSNKLTPKGLAFLHGPIAFVGIVLLIFYGFYSSPSPYESILLFIIAAVGGFLLIFKDLTGQTLPKWLALVHGFIAVLAFIFLLTFVYFHL